MVNYDPYQIHLNRPHHIHQKNLSLSILVAHLFSFISILTFFSLVPFCLIFYVQPQPLLSLLLLTSRLIYHVFSCLFTCQLLFLFHILNLLQSIPFLFLWVVFLKFHFSFQQFIFCLYVNS